MAENLIPCKSCGDPAEGETQYCMDCYIELFLDVTPRPSAPRFTIGTPNDRVERSERAYHGESF